jgi:Predicted membrane protein
MTIDAAGTELLNTQSCIVKYIKIVAVILISVSVFLPRPAQAAFWTSLFTKGNALKATNEGVSFSSSEISSTATFYNVTVDGVTLVFFALRDSANNIRIAMDACDACWQSGKGYTQQGSVMVCQNCAMQFHIARIGMRRGGCNPHPVQFGVAGNMVTIPLTELQSSTRLFKAG